MKDINIKASLIIVGISIIVRFISLYFFQSWHNPNTLEYGLMAESLIQDKGLAFDFYGLRASNPFQSFMPPLYPHLLAFFLLKIPFPYLSLLITQIVLSSLTAVNIYYIGLDLFNRKIALIAGIIVALYPVNIIASSSSFYPVTIDIFLISLVIVCAIKTLINNSLKYAFLTGMTMGILALSLPQILAFYPVIIFWLFINKSPRLIVKGIIIIVMVFLIMSPWIIRNYRIHNQFTISTNGGFNFWMGNNPFTRGTGWDIDKNEYLKFVGDRDIDAAVFEKMPDVKKDPKAFKTALRQKTKAILPKNVADRITELKEVEIEALLLNAGVSYIKQKPFQYMSRCLKKIYYLWFYRPIEGRKEVFSGKLSTLYVIHYAFLTPLVFFSIMIRNPYQRWRKHCLLYLIMVFFTLIYMNFFVLSRYRWLFEPYMILTATFFVISIWNKIRNYNCGKP